MDTLILIVGGNLGDRNQNLVDAYQNMEQIFGNVLMKSAIYETEAWGGKSTGKYLNQVLVFRVSQDEQTILENLQLIENAMGRTREIKWGDRSMDIDILFLSDKIINTPNLQIPHPYLQERRFVLKPLCDVLPNFIHPVFNKKVKELLQECPDKSEVRIYSEN